MESEYQSIERVLKLLLYLLRETEGATREEIYQHVSAYKQAPSESAQRRMFERDIRQIEQVGFRVVRQRGGPCLAARKTAKQSIYKISMPLKSRESIPERRFQMAEGKFSLEQLEKATAEVFQSHGEQVNIVLDTIYGKDTWAFHTATRCLAVDPDKATCIKKALRESGYLQEVAAKLS